MKGFNPRTATDKPYPNYNDIFKLIPELDIYSKYIPNLNINNTISSPIGGIDNNPSFSVFWSNTKLKYIFKEHRYGFTGDCIDFVRILFNLKNNREACMQICVDFNIKDFYIDPNISPSAFSGKLITLPKKKKIKVTIEITIREWQSYDIEFWNQFGITKDWLKRGNIYPIRYYYFNKSIRIAEKYSYAYIEKKDNKISYKIYQPFSKNKKWISNNDHSVWELWYMLPLKGQLLIITKSRKDALSIMATTGIYSTSLQCESAKPKDKIIDELKNRFKIILVLYDNDYSKPENWGRINGKKISKSFNLPQIEIPSNYKQKDYSDLVKHNGKLIAKKVLVNIIKAKIIKIFLNENRERKKT